MLKIVIFDSGYGGEFFADKLEETVPVVNIIRVIDWRNAEKFLTNATLARKLAHEKLRPYINKVDLIVFANHLLTLTSLKYFQRKYKDQRFLGLNLKAPDTFLNRELIILTTKAVTKTVGYYSFLFKLKRNAKTLTLDSWPSKIDDGELTKDEIKSTLYEFSSKSKSKSREVILACSQFNDIKKEIKSALGKNTIIYDSFEDTIRRTCKLLNLRGGIGKKNN